ncbi:MAG: hypothetical protein GKR92_03475 [Gammaproteobacteria bacterium]|nr:MAG: hypothetical protein GKR92_03475 [Gammaproteobacteria bacterium]
MKELVVWVIHTPAGAIGLVAAVVALFVMKGGNIHRKAGNWFTVSMSIMLISGFTAAYLKESTDDMFLSAVVLYTVFTAWLTVKHRKNETGFMEYAALVWIVVFAIAAFFVSAGWRGVNVPSVYLYWGGFAIFCSIGDARNLYQSGLSGIQRIIRHVWRIGFSLIWALLAFTDKIVKMQGSNVKEMPIEQVFYIVGIPTMLVLIVILYWIVNILFFSRKKFANYY